MAAPRRWLHGAAVPLVAALVLGALVAVAILLFRAQTDARESAQRSFAERAHISAALTQSVFSALGGASGADLLRRYGGPPKDLSRGLAEQLRQSHLSYLAVLDARGKTLATEGRSPGRIALATASLKRPALSNVVGRGADSVIEYAIPFGKGANRRAVVQGVPLGLMAKFLHDYLARLRNVDGAGLALIDRAGTTINRQGQISQPGATNSKRLGTSAPVPGTHWTLRLEADRDRVLAGVNRLAWLPWLLLGSLTLAAVAGMGLYVRMRASVGRQRLAMHRQREANRALHESRDHARNLVEALGEAVILYHADGRTELLNAAARELLDTEARILPSLAPGWELLDDDGAPLPSADAPALKAMVTGQAGTQVIGLRRPDGSRRWMTVRARPLVRPDGESPHAVVASCADVTEQREMELHLIDLAQRDSLTGLWNRRRFEDDLAKQLHRCRRYDEVAALLLLDLDGFKQVNDTLGHLAGDEVLRALADGLSQRLRASDSAARIGGDEFAVLLVNVDETEAREMASKVAARLAAFAREHLDADVDLSLSIGVTLLDRDAKGVGDVLVAADLAMYADKRRPGRTPRDAARAAKAIDGAAGSAAADAPLRALLTAVQARDSYTALHSRQVVTLARAVARRLGLEERDVGEVGSVALLHDLGKVAVPDAILLKSSPLSETEQLLMRQHPVVGSQVISSIPELEHLAPAVRAEHERWDGGGYPDGLAKDAIPLASRVTFVCDAYHAMTSDRPYRNALSRDAAIDEIALQAGHQFCPDSAGALLDVLKEQTVELHDAGDRRR